MDILPGLTDVQGVLFVGGIIVVSYSNKLNKILKQLVKSIKLGKY